MKKILAVLLAMLMLVSMAACAPAGAGEETQGQIQGAADNETTGDTAQTGDKFVIGICQFMPHPALDMATEGFIAAVEEGLGKENVTFETQNAAGEASNCSTIVNGLVSSNVDLIMANATPAVAAAYNATETIPILGTSVTEYGVALGIENFSGTVGSNVSGTSDLADLEKQAQMVIDWCPDAKNVGLLFCSAEANSKYQIEEVQRVLESKGLTCEQFGFADVNELSAVAQRACDYADVIYIPTDNTCATYTETIANVVIPANVPVVCGESNTCAGCGVATLSIDYYDLGYTTGKMAAKILKGEADIASMPVEFAPKVTKMYNEANCAALGVNIPGDYQPIS